MKENKSKISCPTFQKQEPLIKEITDRINMAETVLDKAPFAEKLQVEVDGLLSCEQYDKVRIDCRHCHFIANLRKKTANLIIRTKKLA